MTAISTDDLLRKARLRYGSSLQVGADCDLAADLAIEIDEGASLIIGDHVSIRRGTTIQVHRGARVAIGANTAIGENVFISAMVTVRIGEGVGISNMVDIHDHNHQQRSDENVPHGELTPWASGFAGAPIVIESGVVLGNKVSITAGVRIGQNSIIGANAVATRSIRPNTIAAGSPAKSVRSFQGPLSRELDRQVVTFAWYGTSIMEHLEGYNSQMFFQANLPNIGSQVTVEGWHNRGYVSRLRLSIQAEWPHVQLAFKNYGEGGATSRDVVKTIRDTLSVTPGRLDIAFFGCGINDVWRSHQGRTSEAVDRAEYADNCRESVRLLNSRARQVICISETPFGWDVDLDIDLMNSDLEDYNRIAARIAQEEGCGFIDVWNSFLMTASQLAGWSSETRPTDSLWSDGVHLSDLGDALMLREIERFLFKDSTILDTLLTYECYERSAAQAIYVNI